MATKISRSVHRAILSFYFYYKTRIILSFSGKLKLLLAYENIQTLGETFHEHILLYAKLFEISLAL